MTGNRERLKWSQESLRGLNGEGCPAMLSLALLLASSVLVIPARAQLQEPPTPSALQLVHPIGPEGAAPPVTLTFHDALERARKYDVASLAAQAEAKIAHEETVVARAEMLPSTNFRTEELLTKGNGVLPSGRYVTNDGVHVYRSWGVFHQDLSPKTYLLTGYKQAATAEALARAKAEIARRGLVATVAKSYYGLVIAQRKYANAQQSLDQAQRFLGISRDLERGGEVARTDVIKAEIQFSQQKQAFQEAELAMDNARLALAVLISPRLDENFAVVDDLSSAQPLPSFDEVRKMAEHENPNLRAAMEAIRQANLNVSAARAAYLPSITLDLDYGIEANAYALRSVVAAAPEKGPLPNLGHFLTASLVLPIWDWGGLRAKVRQAEYKREQARLELTQTQRQMLSNLYSFYNEALVARSELETLHHAAELAAESLRLVGLRYRAGESTALELVDAQNTLTTARNADADAQARYRVALANLQTLTGNF